MSGRETRYVIEGNSRFEQSAEGIMRPKTSRERWLVLMKLVSGEFPHCIMYGVRIADGVIVSCRGMQRSLSFGLASVVKDGVGPVFDSHWQELEAFCKRMGAGELAELRFRDGRPVCGKTTPQGRRFRYFSSD